jgi:hypothetical protein
MKKHKIWMKLLYKFTAQPRILLPFDALLLVTQEGTLGRWVWHRRAINACCLIWTPYHVWNGKELRACDSERDSSRCVWPVSVQSMHAV